MGKERHYMLKKDAFNTLPDGINYFDSFWKNKLKKSI